MSRTPALTLLVGLIVALAAGCAPEPPSNAPKGDEPRLAVLSPAMTIILRDLGGQDRIVGRHGYDLILASEPVPVVGNESGIDYEALIGADPTVVLLEGNQRGIPDRLRSLAEQRGWELRAIPLLTLDDVVDCIGFLDRLLHPPAGSETGRGLISDLESAWAPSEHIRSTLGRTIALAATDPIGVLGPGSFHHQLIDRLGGHALPERGMPYITWSTEDLKAADPDSLVIFAPGSSEPMEKLLGPIARIGLRAIREDRVFVVRDPLCHTPSTALIRVAQELHDATGEVR